MNDQPHNTKATALQYDGENVPKITAKGSGELAKKIMQLNNFLYSQKKETWDGESFWQVFKNSHALSGQKTKEQTGELEPLYRL